MFGLPESTLTEADRKWKNLFANARLDRGEIKTGGKGKVVLSLADRSKVTLKQDSELTLDQLRHEEQAGMTELNLRRGEMNCQPGEQTQKDHVLLVRTAAVVVKAEGASCSVRHAVKQQLTTVLAMKGLVQVQHRDGGASITLAEGEQISVSTGETRLPTPRKIE